MPEWQVTFPNGEFENYNADRLFITQVGVLVFTDLVGKRQVPYLGLAPGEWKKVLCVDSREEPFHPAKVVPPA